MKTYDVNLTCPYCGAGADAAANPFPDEQNGGPGNGDCVVCATCRKPGTMDNGRVRKPTIDELEIMNKDQRILAMQLISAGLKDKHENNGENKAN